MKETGFSCPGCGANGFSALNGGKLKCTYCCTVVSRAGIDINNLKISSPPCPVCGNRDPGRITFTCPKCGRSNICISHKMGEVCSTCHYDARISTQIKQDGASDRKGRRSGTIIGVIVTVFFLLLMGIIVYLLSW